LADYTLKRRDKFFTLLDQNTLKIDKLKDANSYHNINRESADEKESGIMQDIFMLSELMKNEKSISNLKNIKTLAQSGI
jgi:propanediol dehydratase large subunit